MKTSLPLGSETKLLPRSLHSVFPRFHFSEFFVLWRAIWHSMYVCMHLFIEEILISVGSFFNLSKFADDTKLRREGEHPEGPGHA